jgi:hypothetical protein
MSSKFIIVPLAAALIAATPALAQQVGTATAVNPVSESTPPGGATDKLAVGARVMPQRTHPHLAVRVRPAFVSRQKLAEHRGQHQSRYR